MAKTSKKAEKKSLTLGYIRVSSDDQAVSNQKLEILEYCRVRNLNVDKWVELTISSRKSSEDRKFDELLSLSKGDVLISTEISRLGRSTSEVLNLVNNILKNGTRIIFTKQNLDLSLSNQNDMVTKIVLTIFSMLAELERDIISLRTKEALASKKMQGVKIGKKAGIIQESIYDKRKDEILLLLSKKISVVDISRIIGIGKPRSLMIYLNRRGLRISKRIKRLGKNKAFNGN
ncbi:MAG: DNA-invertase hin [Mycoplasmataceae bacterium]|nr:MAG: DNA-invertase hin [Mycoplasmataceae bacterium]